jgi:hypothetical protein
MKVNRSRVPIPIGVKLSADQCPKTQEEEEDMSPCSICQCSWQLDVCNGLY